MMQCHIPEEVSPKQHSCESHISHVIKIGYDYLFC